MSSAILVVYYSRSGHTRSIAERIARSLGADLEAIREPTARSGTLGYLWSGLQSLLGRRVEIAAPAHDPADYALVLIGTPIWNMGVSSPVRSYLHGARASLSRVGFFATFGGMGAERTFAQMARLVGQPPVATLSIREGELATPVAAVERYVRTLRQAGVIPPDLDARPDISPLAPRA